MFCVRCGAKLENGQSLCPNCGEPVEPRESSGMVPKKSEKIPLGLCPRCGATITHGDLSLRAQVQGPHGRYCQEFYACPSCSADRIELGELLDGYCPSCGAGIARKDRRFVDGYGPHGERVGGTYYQCPECRRPVAEQELVLTPPATAVAHEPGAPKRCRYCGAELPKTGVFCVVCGAMQSPIDDVEDGGPSPRKKTLRPRRCSG